MYALCLFSDRFDSRLSCLSLSLCSLECLVELLRQIQLLELQSTQSCQQTPKARWINFSKNHLDDTKDEKKKKKKKVQQII